MMKSIEIKHDYEAPVTEVVELAAAGMIAASLTTGEDGIDGGEW